MFRKSNLSHTPLRNSSGANSPFRSPFRSINGNPPGTGTPPAASKLSTPSTTPKTSTEKREASSAIEPGKIKRKRLIEVKSPKDAKADGNVGGKKAKSDFILLKKSIRNKQMEIDNLKLKLAYRKKHSKEDLEREISRWRTACHEVLIEYQKDLKEMCGETLEINTILSKLNIPPEYVEFPDDY